MTWFRQNAKFAVAIIAAFVLLVAVFLGGRISAINATSAAVHITPTASPTKIVPTATPDLTLREPHVLATYMLVTNVSCDSCNTITFTSNGPFDMVASCNPFQVFAGSNPSLSIQLFNSNGHLIDTIEHTCGDPNQDVATTIIVPEQLPAGSYQLQASSDAASLTVLILDASQP